MRWMTDKNSFWICHIKQQASAILCLQMIRDTEAVVMKSESAAMRLESESAAMRSESESAAEKLGVDRKIILTSIDSVVGQ